MRTIGGPSCLTALALLLLAGCGGGAVPVSGVVTLDGQALAGASVSFEPSGNGQRSDGRGGSYGKTDASGRYNLRLVTSDGAGALPGTHVVRISLYEEGGEGESDGGGHEKLPLHYNAQTILSHEVPRTGAQNADFALSSDPNPPRR